MATPKSEFENKSGGVIGVIVIENGKEKGIAVKPDATVWLSEDEQILTANAPRKDEDNPFTNGSLHLKTASTDVANRRPIGEGANPPDATEADLKRKAAEEREKEEAERLAAGRKQADQPATPIEETGATIAPTGAPTHGKRSAGEEVATPEAAAAPKPAETPAAKPAAAKPKAAAPAAAE